MNLTMTEAIERLVSERARAIRNCDASKANEITEELKCFGVVLTDERNGTSWHMVTKCQSQ